MDKKKKNSSERAVYAFQHPLLRCLIAANVLRENKKQIAFGPISHRWTHRIPYTSLSTM